jgi:hypothetical protein
MMHLSKPEHRLQFRFWLDVFRPEENALASYVETLKKQRHFAQTIRDALRLIQDLRAGRVEVLLLLFPWIADYFTPPPSQKNEALDPILAQLERLETYFHKAPHTLSMAQPLQLNEPPIEEGDTIQIQAANRGQAAWNLAISAAKLGGNLNILPPEVIRYGVENGHLPAHLLKSLELEPLQEKTLVEAQNGGNSGIRKMEVPDLPPPIWEDDEDEGLALIPSKP